MFLFTSESEKSSRSKLTINRKSNMSSCYDTWWYEIFWKFTVGQNDKNDPTSHFVNMLHVKHPQAPPNHKRGWLGEKTNITQLIQGPTQKDNQEWSRAEAE